MSDPLDSRISEIVQRVVFPVEAGKIREFARAIGDSSPAYTNTLAAQSLGFSAPPAPPTFTAAAAFYVDTGFSHIADTLGLDLKRLVHGEQSWTYHKPVVAGDVLTGVATLQSVTTRETRAGGRMRLAVIATSYSNAAGETVISETMTMVELPPSS